MMGSCFHPSSTGTWYAQIRRQDFHTASRISRAMASLPRLAAVLHYLLYDTGQQHALAMDAPMGFGIGQQQRGVVSASTSERTSSVETHDGASASALLQPQQNQNSGEQTNTIFEVSSDHSKFGVSLIPEETKIQLTPPNRYFRQPTAEENMASLRCTSSQDLQVDFLYVKDVLFGLLDYAFGGANQKQDPAKNAFARQLTRVQHS
ncbi:unnamed protein product [Amoebophrya sp. A120]|nr:unnamed protein product [Amoebophrya sp. A120]|eukprot:GSA120T00012238001.1